MEAVRIQFHQNDHGFWWQEIAEEATGPHGPFLSRRDAHIDAGLELAREPRKVLVEFVDLI